MQTLQISDQVAKQLNDMAAQEHTSSSDLIERFIKKHSQELTKQPELLADFAGILADSPSFSGDPLEIQKAMREDNLLIENVRQQELKAFFAEYNRDLSGFKFDREEANER